MDLSKKRLTLSFDNGPFPDVTPGVLDALRERELRATFFVCGKDATVPERRSRFAPGPGRSDAAAEGQRHDVKSGSGGDTGGVAV